MWEGGARWSTQLCRGCWVATSLSRWMGCSDPQGSGRGRESINPAKMKLCLGCHNPFASSKLSHLASATNCLQCFLHLDDGWFRTIRIQSVEVLPSNFFVGQKWYVGILGKTCCSCKTKKTAATRKPNHKNTQTNNKTRKPNHKYTNKQNNQNLGKQTQPSCVNTGSTGCFTIVETKRLGTNPGF